MDKKTEPEKDAGEPAEFGGMLDQFKDNITITRDDEGVMVKFKTLAPGVTLETLKSMMEGMMGAGGRDMMAQFRAMMGTGMDEEEDDAGSEGDDGDGETGPGFRVEILPDRTGLKLIPDDPAQVDDFLDSIKGIFDPEMFKNMMRSVMQLFGGQIPGFPSMGSKIDPETKENRKKGTDTNMTRDYFYT